MKKLVYNDVSMKNEQNSGLYLKGHGLCLPANILYYIRIGIVDVSWFVCIKYRMNGPRFSVAKGCCLHVSGLFI